MLFSALFRRNISTLEDSELIDLVLKNDKRALGEFFRRYSVLVMGLCLKYLKNQMEAEDMMMDIFEKLPQKIRKSEIKNFRNWLYSVSRNECLMELRKSKRELGDIENTLLQEEDKSEVSLMEMFRKEEKLTAMEKMLKILKPDQKKAVELFYLQNKSYDQVAHEMTIPVKKVKSLIQNGKRNLKIKLESGDEL